VSLPCAQRGESNQRLQLQPASQSMSTSQLADIDMLHAGNAVQL